MPGEQFSAPRELFCVPGNTKIIEILLENCICCFQASKTLGPASKTLGPASKTPGPASKTFSPASKTPSLASKTPESSLQDAQSGLQDAQSGLQDALSTIFYGFLSSKPRQVATKINPKTIVNFNMTIFQKLLQNQWNFHDFLLFGLNLGAKINQKSIQK